MKQISLIVLAVCILALAHDALASKRPRKKVVPKPIEVQIPATKEWRLEPCPDRTHCDKAALWYTPNKGTILIKLQNQQLTISIRHKSSEQLITLFPENTSDAFWQRIDGHATSSKETWIEVGPTVGVHFSKETWVQQALMRLRIKDDEPTPLKNLIAAITRGN